MKAGTDFEFRSPELLMRARKQELNFGSENLFLFPAFLGSSEILSLNNQLTTKN
jgi:hypothetical protein